jgi:predicted  nucleic acid-binding Zn-ribbon protein
LEEAKEFSIDIEENLLDSKIEPFQYPHNKKKSRTKVSNKSVANTFSLLTQNIDQMNTQFDQVRNQLMNGMTTMERNQYYPKP